mgnify:FL=1
MEKKLLSRDEVESHSSMLTNDRINELIKMTTLAQIGAMSSKPDPIRAMELMAVTSELYFQTQFFYDDYIVNKTISQKLAQIFTSKLKEWYILWMTGNLTPKGVADMVLNMIIARFLMIRGMQNLRYFVRMGVAEVKGIEAALRIFNMKEETKELEANGIK